MYEPLTTSECIINVCDVHSFCPQRFTRAYEKWTAFYKNVWTKAFNSRKILPLFYSFKVIKLKQ